MSTSRLSVAAEAVTSATPEAIWPLITDAARYAQWGPWSAAGYQDGASAHEPGAVYWLRSEQTYAGRAVTSVERVEDLEENHRLTYSVLRGMPVRNYRAEILLTPVPEGTRIQWSASWDATILGRLVQRGLRSFFPRAVSNLAAAASAN
jgi:uncharacterized protein YndB with AHSA1/START domain